jgi:hypothetical protein
MGAPHGLRAVTGRQRGTTCGTNMGSRKWSEGIRGHSAETVDAGRSAGSPRPAAFQTSYAGSIPVARSTLDQRKRWVHDRNLRQHGTNEVYSRSIAGRPGTRTKRGTGSIEKLPSGVLRVRVYAGLDPLTKRRHELIEIGRPDWPRRAGDGRPTAGRSTGAPAPGRPPGSSSCAACAPGSPTSGRGSRASPGGWRSSPATTTTSPRSSPSRSPRSWPRCASSPARSSTARPASSTRC